MNDQSQKRRSVRAIAHLFLSCQDENKETTECNPHATPPESSRPTYGIKTGRPDPEGRDTSPALSSQHGEFTSIEPQGLAPYPAGRGAGQNERVESKGSIRLVIDPCGYPVARLVWAEAAGKDEAFQATIPLRKKEWLHVANYCRKRAEQLAAFGPDDLASTWHKIAEFITSEITADEKRQRNRELYGSFADFVAAINARTDIDKARKAQMIHERACRLRVG